MSKLDKLIECLKEFKEQELNKNINMAYSTPQNMAGSSAMKAEAGPNPKVMISKKPIKDKDIVETVIPVHGSSEHQWGIIGDKGTASANPQHKMRSGMKKDEDCGHAIKMESLHMSENGQWMLKTEETNRKASPNVPHNKGDKAKVMPMTDEQHSSAEKVKGKPYEKKS